MTRVAVSSASSGSISLAANDDLLVTASGALYVDDGDVRFIFRTTDRTLWYDVDGDGSAAAVSLAKFDGTTTLTFSDVFVV